METWLRQHGFSQYPGLPDAKDYTLPASDQKALGKDARFYKALDKLRVQAYNASLLVRESQSMLQDPGLSFERPTAAAGSVASRHSQQVRPKPEPAKAPTTPHPKARAAPSTPHKPPGRKRYTRKGPPR